MLPFRNEMEEYPRIQALLDERLGAGRWKPLSIPRMPSVPIFSGVDIGGAYVIEVERDGQEHQNILVLLPTPYTPGRRSAGRLAHALRGTPPTCAVCGAPVTRHNPVRVKTIAGQFRTWHACRLHATAVRRADISDAGELHFHPFGGSAAQ